MFLDDVFLDEKASLCLARVHILSIFSDEDDVFLMKNRLCVFHEFTYYAIPFSNDRYN